eukprot:TRINITY_DN66184_c0_g1_i1.p1 TRINITY_DN66184_c0_g1~~TRINITY_DN66184_c0_g1_i1.p1  ORF type:complete len:306 (-),score=27.66 TRINITY_DN66184_c0_g1_i1:256-1173(-)
MCKRCLAVTAVVLPLVAISLLTFTRGVALESYHFVTSNAFQRQSQLGANAPNYGETESSNGLHGFETCARFRQMMGTNASEPSNLTLNVAGLMNSGTNYLTVLMMNNCEVNTAMVQVPWGKHERAESRGKRFVPSVGWWNVSLVMPVVLVRDPLRWMKSMCKKQWNARIRRKAGCPSPVRHTKVKFLNAEYPSLVHLWNDWYRAYLRFPHPRVFISYEQVLLHPAESVRSICNCLRGMKGGDAWVFQDHVVQANPGRQDFNRSVNLQRQRNASSRYEGYTEDDLRYVAENMDAELARLFGYTIGT